MNQAQIEFTKWFLDKYKRLPNDSDNDIKIAFLTAWELATKSSDNLYRESVSRW